MLILNSTLIGRQIFSLETGQLIASITGSIVDPNNLKVEAFDIKILDDPTPRVLFTTDIRESDIESFSIDGYKNLIQLDAHLVRLQKIIAFNFNPLKLTVEDSDNKVLGEITDYAISDTSFEISRFHYKPSGLRSKIIGDSRVFKRSDIIKLSNKRIIIRG